MGFKEEILKRRTFGIISHPDAGKTTLTEKLLLYGGAIHQAGSVKARKAEKHAIEDARYVLPNACATRIMMTANARSLKNFFRLRCCSRAQWEIRELAEQMYRLVYAVAPTLFGHCGPACVDGVCTEGKMSCGKAAEVRAHYMKLRGEGK